MNEQTPDEISILIALLRFFARLPAEQVEALNEYDMVCREKGGAPHLHDPLIELTEGLYTYCGASVSTPHHPKSFFVGPLPGTAVKTMHSLASVVEQMLTSRLENMFSREHLSRAEWERVRDLAREGLERLARSGTESPLSLFEVMCCVAD
jgi:hypothetical protein